MRRAAFILLSSMERTWWYRGRAAAAEAAFRKMKKSPSSILDYGAGFGGMFQLLSEQSNRVYAFEPDATARAACSQRGYSEVFATEKEALAAQYDVISLFDVLEHIENDEAFVRRISSSLSPEGYLALTVPAFPFLWSVHDVQHQHFRRYRLHQLKKMLREAGYHIQFASYWNMTLFLPAALMRLMGKTGESGLAVPRLLHSILFGTVWSESRVLNYIPLPVGTGIVLLAQYAGKQ